MVRNYKRKTEDRWSKEDLLEALVCIKEAKLKINDAARQYGISRATLYRQYQKFILAGGKCDVNQFRTCGGNPILTKVEEDVLEKTIRDLREQGFTVTSSDIKRICFEYCDSNGIPNQFNQEKRMASDDWYYGFLKRHPDVRIPKPGGGSGSGTPRGSLSGTSGAGAQITADLYHAAAALSSPDKPTKTKKAKSSPHKKLMRHEQLIPSVDNNTVLIASTGEVAALPDGTYVIQQHPPDISSMSPRGKKHKQAAAIIIPPSSPPLKKPLKRLMGDKGAAKRGRKGKSMSSPEPSIPIIGQIVKDECENVDDVDEDASIEGMDMEEDMEQSEAMEMENEGGIEESEEEEEEAESGAEEEEESGDDEQEEGEGEVEGEADENVEVEDDEGGDEEGEVGEEEEQEEQDSDEEGEEEEEEIEEAHEQDDEEQGEESEIAEEQEGEEEDESDEENEEEQEEDSDDEENVKEEKEDSGSEGDGLLEKLLDM